MKDICETSGFSTGAVYNYFKGKNEIVESIAKLSLDRNIEMISKVSKLDAKNPLGKLLNTFFTMLKEMAKDQDAKKYLSIDFELWSESARNVSIAAISSKTQKTTLSIVTDLVKEEQKNGAINKGLDPISIARSLLALLQGLQVQLVLDANTDIDSYSKVCEALITGDFAK